MSYFSHSWLPFIYQYGAGALIFVVGLWITLKSGAFSMAHPWHRKWLVVLVVGFIWYFVLHGGMTLAALGHERTAAVAGAVVMAVSITIGVLWYRRQRRDP